MRPLRLHVLIDALDVGGAEALLTDFCVGARAADLDVTVGYLHDSGVAAVRLREIGIEPIEVPVNSLLGRSARRAVREHVAEVSPDLLHTHLGYADLLGGLAARSLSIPSVSTLHLASWNGGVRERARLRLIAAVRRRCAARVIAVSDAARRAYLAEGWDRSEHVVTIHNGIVDRAQSGAGPGIRGELGIEPDELVLVMVSVLRGGKGHTVAAATAERLAARHPALRLLVLGDGPKRAEIERSMSGLGERVIFAGYRTDVAAVLDAADVLVHPSRADAFPTALLEAMAAGVPSVATAVGGIPEAVAEGETGFLIPAPPRADDLADALEPLLADEGLRARMGAAARARFEAEFTVGRWLERLIALYEETIQQFPRATQGSRARSRP
jgi:glycosyltransferase involved in cell wall biosynthesis